MSTNAQAPAWNVTTWDLERRRLSSFIVLGIAVAVVAGGIATWWFASSTPQWVYWTLVALLVLVLAFMAVLLFVPARTKAMPAAESVAEAPPAEMSAPVATDAPAAYEPRVLTLRCGDCGTIFEITDTGERPLYHTCPGCGAEGALRDPVEAPGAEAAPPAPATYAPAAPAPVHVEAEPAPVAPVKKLKLRCGGCKEVFSIEDTGERPLKRACPHCGRIGKIG